jgi:cytochrome c556
MRSDRSAWAKSGLLAASAALLVGAAADDASGIVAGRQAAFRLSGAVYGGMKPVIDAGGDVAPLARNAGALANWAEAIPGMFPAGSGTAASGALPTVWSDRAGFEKAAADYRTAATALATVAKSGDKAAFAAQWTAVGQTCNACHKIYRKPDKH